MLIELGQNAVPLRRHGAIVLAAIGLTLPLGLSTPALANAADAHSEITALKISQVDLSTELGVQKVYQTLRQSASRVCDSHNVDDAPQTRIDKHRRCMTDTMDFYVEYLSHSRLTALHAVKAG